MAVTINIDSQIVVQTAAQWAADTTVYSAQRILITSDETYTGTDQRKFKIANGADTWSNLDYFPVGGSVTWGGITGTLSDQTDLQGALDAKLTGGEGATTGLFQSNGASLGSSLILATDANKKFVTLDTSIYPSLTELERLKGITSPIQTQTNTITSQYQEILQGGVLITSAISGSYFMSTQQNGTQQVGVAGALPPAMIHIVAADYPAITGRSPKLRTRVVLACNDVAPARNFTISMYPITRPATSGGSGVLAYTVGTAVAGSGIAINTPAADSLNTAVSNDFDFPADGVYALVVDLSGTTAVNSSVHIQVSLQVHYV